ncbi:transcriptional repressor LexA [Mesorhizobium sp. MSK_1335]|uniref:LexA repressor n=1 Tax=Mesorhizobium montanum TaxID=3072323 RepID=A0ABU4ZUQ9_9HYPH|nr:transcriptional repressor LexA [Mesorhizobium sp. MSK_1335]MDX8527758.1 transcriptional repressor LexA [Mesorhizobium sp. MSK_1335]
MALQGGISQISDGSRVKPVPCAETTLEYCKFLQYLGGMSTDRELTPRQRQIFEYVEERMVTAGAPPTLKEICGRFRFRSPNAAREHLRLIEQKGYLKRERRRARGIRIDRENSSLDELVRVPLLGRIVAGNPNDAIENIEARIPLPRALLRGTRLFALRVGGSSMEGAGIFDGDIAILNSQAEVTDGEIAAVLVGDEATLKRVFRIRDGIRLQAENSEFPDLVLDQFNAGALRVAGVLVGILRTV